MNSNSSHAESARAARDAVTVITQSATDPNPELEQQLKEILNRVPPVIPTPRAGKGHRCPYTGKSRTFIMELITPNPRNEFTPPVKAIYRKSHKYAKRGTWLIPAEALFRYLLGLAETSVESYRQTSEIRKAA